MNILTNQSIRLQKPVIKSVYIENVTNTVENEILAFFVSSHCVLSENLLYTPSLSNCFSFINPNLSPKNVICKTAVNHESCC